jgi:hypothetical protein
MTRILIVLFFLLFEMQPVVAANQCKHFSVKGDVKEGSEFNQEIGMDLSFRMEPSNWDGWTFEIGPTNPSKDEWNNYIYTLNPPYRGRHLTMLDTSYGILAQDAVKQSSIDFWFLSNRKASSRAKEALDKILWPNTDTAQDESLTILGSLPMGQGNLKILDSDVTPGTAKPEDDPEHAFFGSVKSIMFKVDFYVSANFKPAKGLYIEYVACPKHNAWLKQ